jgi:predicted hydrocarbon binding protein
LNEDVFFDKVVRPWMAKHTKMADKELIRKKLGDTVDLSVYQMRVLGTLAVSKSMGPVMYEAGRRLGAFIMRELVRSHITASSHGNLASARSLKEARLSLEVPIIQQQYKMLGIGVVQLTEYEKGKLVVFQVEECSDCFGVGNIGKTVCYYVGGNLGAVTSSAMGRNVAFAESKCCANGDEYCEFRYSVRKA